MYRSESLLPAPEVRKQYQVPWQETQCAVRCLRTPCGHVWISRCPCRGSRSVFSLQTSAPLRFCSLIRLAKQSWTGWPFSFQCVQKQATLLDGFSKENKGKSCCARTSTFFLDAHILCIQSTVVVKGFDHPYQGQHSPSCVPWLGGLPLNVGASACSTQAMFPCLNNAYQVAFLIPYPLSDKHGTWRSGGPGLDPRTLGSMMFYVNRWRGGVSAVCKCTYQPLEVLNMALRISRGAL